MPSLALVRVVHQSSRRFSAFPASKIRQEDHWPALTKDREGERTKEPHWEGMILGEAQTGESAVTISKSFFKVFFLKTDFKGRILRVILGWKLNSKEKKFFGSELLKLFISHRQLFQTGKDSLSYKQIWFQRFDFLIYQIVNKFHKGPVQKINFVFIKINQAIHKECSQNLIRLAIPRKQKE